MNYLNEKYKLSRYNAFYQSDEATFIWNTYSDALLKLNNIALKYIHSFSGNDDKSVEFNLLKSNGFIIHEQIDEFGRICSHEKQTTYNLNASEISFVITPTMSCNYRCKYCFQTTSDKSKVMTPEIAIDVVKYICQQLENNKNAKELRISWFGGEPLLNLDVIEIISHKLKKYTKQNDINYSALVTTNGRFLDAKTLTLLKEFHVEKVQITVDGTCDLYCNSKGALPEDFDCVVNNISYAAEKMKLAIRLNIPNNDVEEAIVITNYLFNHRSIFNNALVYFAYVCDYSLKPNDARKAFIDYTENYFKWLKYVINQYGKNKANIPIPKRKSTSCKLIDISNSCIGTYGDLYKCEHNFGDDSMVIGDIWHGHFFNDAENSFYSAFNTTLKEKCSCCEYLPVCMGGCPHDLVRNFVRVDCKASQRMRFKLKLIEGGIIL